MAGTLGVVVAGGHGRRLGSALPKAQVSLAGLTLLERAIRTLEPWCDELIVATSPAVTLRAGPHRVVVDDGGPPGPLAGIVTGLKAAPFARALVLAVDLPLVGGALFEALLARLGGHAAVIPEDEERWQPLAAVYAPPAAEALARARAGGATSLIQAVRDLDPRVLPAAELAALGIAPGTFLNVNTAEDLARAGRRLAARPAAAGA